MKNDPLNQFLALRKTLQQERATILQRLAQIESVLSPGQPASAIAAAAKATPAKAAPAKAAQAAKPARKAPRRRKASRKPGQPSLKAVVRQLTAAKPLSKAEILGALKQMGRSFARSSLNGLLYDKATFKRADGKFSPLA